MILVSVDVTLIDKARLKEFKRRNGSIGKSLELVLFESKSEYGDYMVKQQVTKEEREARKEMPILGNGKIVGQAATGGRSRPAPAAKDADGEYERTETTPQGRDVPF